MAKMPKFKYVLGRRFFVQNKVTVSVTVSVRMSLGVRLGMAIMRLGAWICGISVNEEEESDV
jgi:hypothetical protein